MNDDSIELDAALESNDFRTVAFAAVAAWRERAERAEVRLREALDLLNRGWGTGTPPFGDDERLRTLLTGLDSAGTD